MCLVPIKYTSSVIGAHDYIIQASDAMCHDDGGSNIASQGYITEGVSPKKYTHHRHMEDKDTYI